MLQKLEGFVVEVDVLAKRLNSLTQRISQLSIRNNQRLFWCGFKFFRCRSRHFEHETEVIFLSVSQIVVRTSVGCRQNNLLTVVT
jgi:hypothetical protein